MFDAAKRSNVVIHDSCKDALLRIRNQIHVEAAPKFDKDGKLISGSWIQVVFYAGCGVVRTLNVLISVEAGSRSTTRALLPGTTHANPPLQLDVFNSAVQHLQDQWRAAKCTEAYVDDTAFIDQDSKTEPGTREPRWLEAWTIAACDRRQVILVAFAPDASGTSFSFKTLDTRRIGTSNP